MKILVNVPCLNKPGGVSNHYIGLRPYWTERVVYNVIGGRRGLPGPFVLFYDYLKFLLLCMFGRYDAVVLNPSLGTTAVLRDSVFLFISTLFGLKTIIFIHGWDSRIASKIDQHPRLTSLIISRASSFIVLASEFEISLRKWGANQKIFLETTKVDDRLIESFNLEQKKYSNTLLFLARIEHNKGVLVALEAFRILKPFHPKTRLLVAGTGSALLDARKHCEKYGITDVEFLGHVSGSKLIQAFSESSIYILPTTHGEGMPTSVLEAMNFGLVVVTRPVGGIVDFFDQDNMGCLTKSVDPQEYARILDDLLANPSNIKRIGAFNHMYAKCNFMASKVAVRIEKHIKDS